MDHTSSLAPTHRRLSPTGDRETSAEPVVSLLTYGFE